MTWKYLMRTTRAHGSTHSLIAFGQKACTKCTVVGRSTMMGLPRHHGPTRTHQDLARTPPGPQQEPTWTSPGCHVPRKWWPQGVIGFLQRLWPGRREGSKNLKHQKLFLTKNGVLNNLCNSYLGKLWHGNAHYPTCLVMQGRVVALNKNPPNHIFSRLHELLRVSSRFSYPSGPKWSCRIERREMLPRPTFLFIIADSH